MPGPCLENYDELRLKVKMDPIQERKIEEIIQQGLNPYASSFSSRIIQLGYISLKS